MSEESIKSIINNQEILREAQRRNREIVERISANLVKQEMYYGKVYNSFDELKDAIDKYICYYNEKRSKASLGYRSPIEYRNEMLAA